jgi:arylformamidase
MFSSSAEIYDITVPIIPGMPVWPGDPAVEVAPVMRTANGDGANISRLNISSHTGTHVDPPWHYIDNGERLLEIPLARWIGPCHVIEIPAGIPKIEPEHLEAAQIPLDTTRLIVKTTNSRIWETVVAPFDTSYVALSPAAARWVIDRSIELVGIDYLSIESYDGDGETHVALLSNGILVIEGLDLRAISPGPYTLVCLPLKLEAGDGAPARVLLVREP